MINLPIAFSKSGISLDFGGVDGATYTVRRPHMGTDWSSYRLGAFALPIYASGPGTVVFNGVSRTAGPVEGHPSSAHGNSIAVRYDAGFTAHYSHRRAANGPRAGSRVDIGTFLGNVGNTGLSTGEHLHLDTWQNGARLSPHRFFDFTQPVGGVLASSRVMPFLIVPKEDNMVIQIRRKSDGLIAMVAPDYFAALGTVPAADLLRNVWSIANERHELDDAEFFSVTDTCGIPRDEVRGGNYWSRELDNQRAITDLRQRVATIPPAVDVSALAAALKAELVAPAGETIRPPAGIRSGSA